MIESRKAKGYRSIVDDQRQDRIPFHFAEFSGRPHAVIHAEHLMLAAITASAEPTDDFAEGRPAIIVLANSNPHIPYGLALAFTPTVEHLEAFGQGLLDAADALRRRAADQAAAGIRKAAGK